MRFIPTAASMILTIVVILLAVVITPIAFVIATFNAGNSVAPGNVPQEAAMPIMGPIRGETPALETLIGPWYGSRYVFGGNVIGGVDCSGFTVAIFRQLGINLPRTAQSQYNVSRKVNNPRPLDLVYFYGTYDSRPDFISHVGIYLGDGIMVSAVEPYLGRQSLDTPYWRQHFVSFGRVLND